MKITFKNKTKKTLFNMRIFKTIKILCMASKIKVLSKKLIELFSNKKDIIDSDLIS